MYLDYSPSWIPPWRPKSANHNRFRSLHLHWSCWVLAPASKEWCDCATKLGTVLCLKLSGKTHWKAFKTWYPKLKFKATKSRHLTIPLPRLALWCHGLKDLCLDTASTASTSRINQGELSDSRHVGKWISLGRTTNSTVFDSNSNKKKIYIYI